MSGGAFIPQGLGKYPTLDLDSRVEKNVEAGARSWELGWDLLSWQAAFLCLLMSNGEGPWVPGALSA